MRVTVLHNQTAGEDDIRAPDLLAALRAAGHEVRYYDTDDKRVFRRVQDPGDVLLAAGGDGTVRKVALKLGHLGAPIAVLPLGTANNIARTIGIPDGIDAAIALLETGRRVEFDLGTVRYAGKKRRFIEGVGVGLFAESMTVVKELVDEEVARYEGADAELRRDIHMLRTLLRLQRPLRCRVEVDGRKVEQEVLLGAVLNIRSVGPRLLLAPDASPGDGQLDVILIAESERAAFTAYLDDRIAGRAAHPPRLQRWRGEKVRLRWDSPLGHFDDKPLPRRKGSKADAPLDLEIGVEPGALRFIAP